MPTKPALTKNNLLLPVKAESPLGCETAPVRDPTGMLLYLVARIRKIAA
jgi:hypothetical protein